MSEQAPERLCFVHCGLPADQCACYRKMMQTPPMPAHFGEYITKAQHRAELEAVREACAKLLNKYAAEHGSTKTPMGRTANFYARKIRALDIDESLKEVRK